MYNNENILVFDWEMAGMYTLGYDLFTYIFQTCFLLDSENQIKNIIVKNIKPIEYYFSHFNLKNWKPYLIAFAEHKVSLERSKGDNMINNYLKLLKYAKEA